jgi:hypothetical protein
MSSIYAAAGLVLRLVAPRAASPLDDVSFERPTPR